MAIYLVHFLTARFIYAPGLSYTKVVTVKRMGAFLIGILLLAGLFLTAPAYGEMDSLVVVMTTDKTSYVPGDEITIEIRVYENTVLADADYVNLTRMYTWTDINTTHVSTGLYTATYTSGDHDHSAHFEVDVTKGTDHETGELYIRFADDDLFIDITYNDQSMAYASPGDTVTATIKTTYRGGLVDVDEFTELRLLHPDDNRTNLTETRVGVGTYEVDITIPDTNTSTEHILEVEAEYAGDHEYTESIITVNLFTVWYHEEERTGNTVTFKLGVADMTGASIQGANIVLTDPDDKTGTTGADGTALFTLTDLWGTELVEGYATYEGKNQSFRGVITIEHDGPQDHELDIIYQGGEELYTTGQSISRSYKAYNDTEPLSNKEIFYYVAMAPQNTAFTISTPHNGIVHGNMHQIKAGTVTTGQLGDFTVSFTLPSYTGIVSVYFEGAMPLNPPHNVHNNPGHRQYDLDDDMVYEEILDEFMVYKGEFEDSPAVDISAEPLVVGGSAEMSVEATIGDGMIFAALIPGGAPGDDFVDHEAPWDCWVDGGDRIMLEETSPGMYTGDVVIPGFMDEDEYTIVAGYADESGAMYFDQVALEEGEGTGILGGSEESDLMLLILILVVIIAVLILVIGLMKKKGTAAPPPMTPEEEPQLDIVEEPSVEGPVAEEPAAPASSVTIDEGMPVGVEEKKDDGLSDLLE